MKGGKIKYTGSVLSSIKQTVKKEIIQATEQTPEFKSEIRRVFQMANRRIQNVESKGLLSPAVTALNKGDIQGFTKFSMKGDFETLKREYAKAVGLLRQPTSTASRTRQNNKHLMEHYKLTQDEFNLMSQSLHNTLTSLSESDFVERYLMRYKDFTGELEMNASDVSDQIEDDAEQLEKVIENAVEQSANMAATESEDYKGQAVQEIIDSFKDFGL